jgi:hypothetical protein
LSAKSEQVVPGQIQILRRWNADALETKGLVPCRAISAVILWREYSNVEAGPSARLADALLTCLLRFGEITFRISGVLQPGLRAIANAPKWARIGRANWTVVTTGVIDAARLVFEFGWSMGDQIAILGASETRASYLFEQRDLSDVELRSDETLFSAVVDGAGMLVCAASANRLEVVLNSLSSALIGNGYVVEDVCVHESDRRQ